MRWTLTAEERFWVKVEVGLCWQWTAGTTSHGYGQFWLNGKRVAHQVAWEWLVGPVPDGLELDHLCRNTLCVNPDHLEAVPHRENARRGATGKTTGARNRAKTHCPSGHPYTEHNTFRGTNGSRTCRECNRTRSREYQRRMRRS